MQHIRDALQTRGYYFIHATDASQLEGLCLSLGVPKSSRLGTAPIRDISPQIIPDRKNTLSGRYGLDAFPFHTDTAFWRVPARYVLLRCVNPGSGCRPTLLNDSREWNLSDSDTRLLENSVWRTTNSSSFLCSVIVRNNSQYLLRFDRDCMRPMTRKSLDAYKVIEAKTCQPSAIRVDWHTNDLLIIDNHRLLHARGAAIAPDLDRVLTRVLIEERL
jgi:L-asparagine oxygenase